MMYAPRQTICLCIFRLVRTQGGGVKYISIASHMQKEGEVVLLELYRVLFFPNILFLNISRVTRGLLNVPNDKRDVITHTHTRARAHTRAHIHTHTHTHAHTHT